MSRVVGDDHWLNKVSDPTVRSNRTRYRTKDIRALAAHTLSRMREGHFLIYRPAWHYGGADALYGLRLRYWSISNSSLRKARKNGASRVCPSPFAYRGAQVPLMSPDRLDVGRGPEELLAEVAGEDRVMPAWAKAQLAAFLAAKWGARTDKDIEEFFSQDEALKALPVRVRPLRRS